MRVHEPESVVVAIARGQHGVVSWRQIARAGLSARWVQNRLDRGWLRRMHRGVYLVGPLESPYTRPMAATLAVGAGALISHYAAAVLWGFLPPTDDPIDVTLPGRKARNRQGLRVHRHALHPGDASRRHGIPVTSAARTLLDLATTDEVERALNEAHLHKRVSTHSLNEQFSRYPHHPGTAALKEAAQADRGFTRSEAERRMLHLIREAGLPAPEVNARIAGYEVDFLWRGAKLVVEIDGYAFHAMRRSFEHDRRKDTDLAAAGMRVARVTWRQLHGERIRVATRLATALAA